MLSVPELEQLMAELESDRVERKESAADGDRIRQAICAFANDLPRHGVPGYLFIGVNDRGQPTSLEITDALLLTLAGMRSDGNVLPIPSMNVQKVELHGVSVAVVEVHPSDSPPVRFKGRVWIRVGPRRDIATLEEERRLTERQVAGIRTFDQRGCNGTSIRDLLAASFQSDYLPRVVDHTVITQDERSIEEQLASLGFFDVSRQVPSYAGLLLFGQDPLQFLPGAYIQFVRFDGDTLADNVQDEKQITGNLLTQLLQLDTLLPLQIHTARGASSGLRHEGRPDYPLVAVRELVLNAVIHRAYEGTNAPIRINWFADRVEIQNPGGLYGQVTEYNFDRVSDYRNPVLAGAMKVLGYVERFGAGIQRCRAALAKNGSPAAEFTFEPTHVLVVVRRLR